ncbi:hypothetical protein CapIbe_012059 [Capra ibex]
MIALLSGAARRLQHVLGRANCRERTLSAASFLTRQRIQKCVARHIVQYQDILSASQGTPKKNNSFNARPRSLRGRKQRQLPFANSLS